MNENTQQVLSALGQISPLQQQSIPRPQKMYIQFNTQNKSFLDMHFFLKNKGIRNNSFMLLLYDPDLANINPRDPNLPFMYKQRVWRECMLNYWYFLREIVRIQDQGGSLQGVPYKLHRGNLAFNFCSLLNMNTFTILPRQQFKTVSSIVRYLYLFNFGTTNSSIYFLHQINEKSKENLQILKNIRALLPPYLRFDTPVGVSGKMIKPPDSIEKLGHISNFNVIKTVASAQNKTKAGNLIRGKTVPLLWFDEYAFIPFNKTVYLNGIPAYKTAAMNAKRNGRAYGINITTTPGDLMTEEGEEAFNFRNDCTKFDESWYDLPYSKIMLQVDKNKKTNFVRIEYTYQQLGLPETWFEEICKDMRYEWDEIKREVLLEWNLSVPNAFFSQAQLEAIKRKVRDPIKTILIFDKYPVDIYFQPEYQGDRPKYPPIIGVDVSGGYMKDYSSFVIIDSQTTMPIAAFKDNSIDPDDLAYVIIELVTKFMPNAIVNVEKTGIGASTVKILKKSKIKQNLYYELKERTLEERFDGIHVVKHNKKIRVYGMDNTKESRPMLIQILRERGRDHKDKFLIKDLYDELRALEVKPNGRVEANKNYHDDMTFAYLMALYVWYYGVNVHQWGLEKTTIRTDEDVDEEYFGDDPNYTNMTKEFNRRQAVDKYEEDSEAYAAVKQLEAGQKAIGIMYRDWEAKERQIDEMSLQEILSTPQGRLAYAKKYNVPNPDDIKATGTYEKNYRALSKLLYSSPEDEEMRIKNNFNFNSFFGKIGSFFNRNLY